MKTLQQLEESVNFPDRYYQLCKDYTNREESLKSKKPLKADVLAILENEGYNFKYYSGDKIYIESTTVGKYIFEYYLEFNGMEPGITIYIKTTSPNEEWPLWRYAPGFVAVKKKYFSNENGTYNGPFIYATNLEELKEVLRRLKPMLDELRLSIMSCLEKDELDFTLPK